VVGLVMALFYGLSFFLAMAFKHFFFWQPSDALVAVALGHLTS